MSTKNQHSLLLIGVVLVLAITFETLQQQYYIKRFNLGDQVYFFDLLKNQAYRWLIWIALGFVLIPITKYLQRNGFKFAKKSVIISLGILLLVALNIAFISIVESALNGDGFSTGLILGEYMPFFTFQKAPIYVLGYIAISIILDQQLINQELEFKIQALHEVKKTNQDLYKQLAKQQSDKTQVLNIKVGNKRKIIPITDILWIGSDDYCVKIHTQDKSYTMRSSLKQLEATLGDPFLRIHRQAIVNMDAVSQYRASDQSAVLVGLQQWVPVSKKNLRRVKEYLQA